MAEGVLDGRVERLEVELVTWVRGYRGSGDVHGNFVRS